MLRQPPARRRGDADRAGRRRAGDEVEVTASTSSSDLLRLQRSAGNSAVVALLRRDFDGTADPTAAQAFTGRGSYGVGQHGFKTKEQEHLTAKGYKTGPGDADTLQVSGDTHESEHVLGYSVLAGDTGLDRKKGHGSRLEKEALAYQEVEADHALHPGTGSSGRPLADPERFGPDEVSSVPGKAGWTAESYRLHQRRALEEGHVGNAIQLNQLGYGDSPAFKRQAEGTLGGAKQQASDESYTRMLQGMDQASFAHTVGDEARIHTLDLSPEEKAEAELARRVARGDCSGPGGWPTPEEEDEVRAMFGLA